MTEQIAPYRLDVPQADLDDLARRLDATRWAAQPAGVGWSHGIPTDYLRELAGYWRDGYDWRAAEARLNSFPQFTTGIDGTDVHFLQVRSDRPGALPLLLTHGWPGSIVEFLDLIGPLTDPAGHGGDPADAFDVVVPSIPGFGLPGAPALAGWGVPRVAAAWVELMARLGYGRYVAHGGDYGAMISRAVGLAAPDRLAAVHLTMVPTANATRQTADLSVDAERRSRDATERYRSELGAYAMLQASRPQTLAHALTDSPVGQLAWIVERFKDWTDSVDSPEDAVDRDTLLTNVMLYWLTGSAGSSARYYQAGAADWGTKPEYLSVPTAVAVLPRDIGLPVRRLAEPDHHIVRWTEFPRGGHFAALEAPDLLLADLRAAFRPYR